VLVQANYGRRGLLRVDGVPVGEQIGIAEVPSPWSEERRGIAKADRAPGSGSIIGILATDAPLLPHQCARIARRAPLGVARVGGLGSTTSGDLFLAFATGNRGMPPTETEDERDGVISVRGLVDRALDPLFEAAVEATEEAILNALLAAETMTGRDGITAHRLPHDRFVEVMGQYGRLRA
jgi:D-aminopeptidase